MVISYLTVNYRLKFPEWESTLAIRSPSSLLPRDRDEEPFDEVLISTAGVHTLVQ